MFILDKSTKASLKQRIKTNLHLSACSETLSILSQLYFMHFTLSS